MRAVITLLTCACLLAATATEQQKDSAGRYGVIVKDKLIPEVVKHGAIEVGRFEVTRAQYHEWDSGYFVKDGTANQPANEITPAEAQGYVDWLSTLTGDAWRLPKEEEVAGLERKLDVWVLGKDGKVKLMGSHDPPEPEHTGFRVVRAQHKP